jgi:uncharacterized protein YbjT (DUF2867 family)
MTPDPLTRGTPRTRDSTPGSPAAALSSPTGSEPELSAEPNDNGTAPLVLVLGATGYIGGRLVPRLLNGGYSVRVLVRSPERLAAFSWTDSVETRIGDARNGSVVSQAMAGVDVVYFLVHSLSSGKHFSSIDRDIAQNVTRAARSAGVKRIVYLGGLFPEHAALSPHLASRKEVGELLLASGVPTIVLRAGVVIGSGSASFEMIRHLTEVLPYMPAPKWVRNFIQPISVRDVLYYLLAAARLGPEVSRAVDIGGPAKLRYGQMMNGYAVAAGLPQRGIAALPVLTPRLASHWVGLVTPVPRALARPLVESLQQDCVMKNHDIDTLIPPPPNGLASYRSAVELALGRVELDQVETSWRDAQVHEAPSDPLPSDPGWAGRTVLTDDRSRATTASRAALWSVIEGIGGENGWYSPPLLWAMRGWMDRTVGGVGLKRGRRNQSTVSVGDAIDFWRVEVRIPERMLRLRAEMKLPGLAWLELGCEEQHGRLVYRQRAIFFPRGLSGRLYWWSVLPFHGLIFAGMLSRIVAIAEAETLTRTGSEPPAQHHRLRALIDPRSSRHGVGERYLG